MRSSRSLERGYRVLLAHPERAAIFLGHPQRLRALVEQGALCSITARALTGRFGQGPKWFAYELLRDGLVHSVDSDAHNVTGARPGCARGCSTRPRRCRSSPPAPAGT